MKNRSKRDKFYAETLKLFHEKGFKATTMRDIARQMGFKVANIYNYVDSKQSLLDMFLFGIADEYHKDIDDILASSYSPREKLRAVISSQIRLPATRPYEIGLMLNEWRNLKEPRLTQYIDERKQYDLKLRSILLDGMEVGEFRQIDPDIATQTILASLRWPYRWFASETRAFNPIEMEKQMLEVILGGISV